MWMLEQENIWVPQTITKDCEGGDRRCPPSSARVKAATPQHVIVVSPTLDRGWKFGTSAARRGRSTISCRAFKVQLMQLARWNNAILSPHPLQGLGGTLPCGCVGDTSGSTEDGHCCISLQRLDVAQVLDHPFHSRHGIFGAPLGRIGSGIPPRTRERLRLGSA